MNLTYDMQREYFEELRRHRREQRYACFQYSGFFLFLIVVCLAITKILLSLLE